jgi:hypothetical protein
VKPQEQAFVVEHAIQQMDTRAIQAFCADLAVYDTETNATDTQHVLNVDFWLERKGNNGLL